MRMTKEDTKKTTKTFKFVQKNISSNSPSNVILTLFLLQRTGGEMYGM